MYSSATPYTLECIRSKERLSSEYIRLSSEYIRLSSEYIQSVFRANTFECLSSEYIQVKDTCVFRANTFVFRANTFDVIRLSSEYIRVYSTLSSVL